MITKPRTESYRTSDIEKVSTEPLEFFPGFPIAFFYKWKDFAMRVSITLQSSGNLRNLLLSLGNALGKEIQRRSKSLIAFLQVPSL